MGGSSPGVGCRERETLGLHVYFIPLQRKRRTNGDVKVKSMSTSGFTAFIDNLVPEGSGGAIMSGTGNITYIAIGKDN